MTSFSFSEFLEQIAHILAFDPHPWFYFEGKTLYAIFYTTYKELVRCEPETTCYDVNLSQGKKYYGDNWNEDCWTTLMRECPTFPDIPFDNKKLQFRYIVFA